MKQFKRIMVVAGGGTVLVIGIAMIVLPGPAILMIPAGLATLAVEFAWARRWLRSARVVLPNRSSNSLGKFSIQSVRRSLEFLFRQVRRTLRPKAKLVSG